MSEPTHLRKPKLRVPAIKNLLKRYERLGVPRRKGWLYDIYPAPRGAWVVLYTRHGADNDLTDEEIRQEWQDEAGVISYGESTLGGAFKRIKLPEVNLLLFQFRTRDDLLTFQRAAMQSLRELVQDTEVRGRVRDRLTQIATQEQQEQREHTVDDLEPDFFDWS